MKKVSIWTYQSEGTMIVDIRHSWEGIVARLTCIVQGHQLIWKCKTPGYLIKGCYKLIQGIIFRQVLSDENRLSLIVMVRAYKLCISRMKTHLSLTQLTGHPYLTYLMYVVSQICMFDTLTPQPSDDAGDVTWPKWMQVLRIQLVIGSLLRMKLCKLQCVNHLSPSDESSVLRVNKRGTKRSHLRSSTCSTYSSMIQISKTVINTSWGFWASSSPWTRSTVSQTISSAIS